MYDVSPERFAALLNYRSAERGQGVDCPIAEDGDFNVDLSTALSAAELHIKEEERETKGVVYLCFDISADACDYLFERRYAEEIDPCGSDWQDVALCLNNVQKTGTTKVEIGGAFHRVTFSDRYEIAE